MFAVIYIPDFELQAVLRLEPELTERPTVLIDEKLPKAVVIQFTDAARKSGIEPGLTSVQAMARCRDVVIKSRSTALESAAGEALLQCAYCFSPYIEATAPGICTLDLRGLPESGTAEWGETVLSALSRIQLNGRLGVAETPALALHAARAANPVLAVTNSTEFVSALPIEQLDAPPEMIEILEKWGIHTIGAFLGLGKSRIAERLGAEAVELYENALARDRRPLNLMVPPATFEERMEFENPVESLEPLLFILRRFIDQLSRRLEVIYLVAEELELILGLTSGAKYERLFRVPSPTRDIETLFRMLHTHLEGVRTDSPIQSLQLSAKPCRPQHHQFGLFEAALRDPNQFHQTLARLTALLGDENVGTPRVLDTHRPDAVKMEKPQFETSEPAGLDLDKPIPALGLALRRFRPPIPATVEMRDGKPALMRSAAFTGPIVDSRGPWRSSGNWWDTQDWERDEWDVQTRNGDLYRLVCEGTEWTIEGVFD